MNTFLMGLMAGISGYAYGRYRKTKDKEFLGIGVLSAVAFVVMAWVNPK